MHPQIRHSLVITSTGLHHECYCAVVYKQCDISNSKTFLTFSVCIVVWVEGEYIYIIKRSYILGCMCGWSRFAAYKHIDAILLSA